MILRKVRKVLEAQTKIIFSSLILKVKRGEKLRFENKIQDFTFVFCHVE